MALLTLLFSDNFWVEFLGENKYGQKERHIKYGNIILEYEDPGKRALRRAL